MKVAILAKGKSIADFPGREGFDEVWGLNQIAQTHDLDRLFVMDDLELRLPYYDGDEFPQWLKSYSGRLITSKAYPDWPTSEAFPIEAVVVDLGLPLGLAMYSTTDYMFAMAIHERVDEIFCYGVDVRGPNMEMVRSSIMIWTGAAMARGMTVRFAKPSLFAWWTQTGTCIDQGLYGYVQKPRIENLIESVSVTEGSA